MKKNLITSILMTIVTTILLGIIYPLVVTALAQGLFHEKDKGDNPQQLVPIDLVTTSGSGLDPHISPASAALQVARIASTRKISQSKVSALISNHTEQSTLGILGEPRVNVLLVNLDLDGEAPYAAPAQGAAPVK